MLYENVRELVGVELDGEGVTLTLKCTEDEGTTLLRFTTEKALYIDPATDEVVWVMTNYGDLVAEALADYLSGLLS